MIPAMLLALVVAADKAEAPSARVFLKAAAATAPACRTTAVDKQLVRAALFAPESAQCPVASVDGDVIALVELAGAFELAHLSRSPRASASKSKSPDMDFTPALDRLIAGRLIAQEAREMRLDEDPKFRAAAEDYRTSRLRTMVQAEATRGLKPDPAEVERLYADAVREWKIKSVLFEKEEAAKEFEAALKAGGGFDALAKKFVDEKKAKGGADAEFVGPKHLLPEIHAAARQAKPGVPTAAVRVPSGWVVLRVDGSRVPPKDAAARAEARKRSLARKEHEAVRGFYLSLVKRHAKVDRALLKQIDFEAKGEKGFQALLADKRPIATIAGEAPITVADLTTEISLKFFHGIAAPIQEKRVNRHKDEAFERLLGMRLFAREAAARKLAERPEYRREVEEYERALAFNTFVEKVIAPDVKVTEADVARYYEQNKAQFTAPQMYRLDGFAFPTTREAQAALDKLKAGTDFAWLRSSAPGQLPAEKRKLQFDGATVSANTLPRDLVKALTGARAGEYRLYAARPTEVYVIRVIEQMPPAAQPYGEAREGIAKRLFDEKLAIALNDYAGKLRKAQPVDVLITRVSF